MAVTGPIVERTERGALGLSVAYWDEIRRLTVGLVSVCETPGGPELRLARVLTLFRFGPPRATVRDDEVECRFAIIGGLLAKEEGGWLTFTQRMSPNAELEVAVEDYVPLLSSTRPRRSVRRFVYRQVQQRAHRAIGLRYLERMAARAR